MSFFDYLILWFAIGFVIPFGFFVCLTDEERQENPLVLAAKVSILGPIAAMFVAGAFIYWRSTTKDNRYLD
jgi:hypothetical protein